MIYLYFWCDSEVQFPPPMRSYNPGYSPYPVSSDQGGGEEPAYSPSPAVGVRLT